MARRQETTEEQDSFSWYNQPLYNADDEEADLFRDVDDEPASSKDSPRPRAKRKGKTTFSGGCFNVLTIAVFSILVFAALGIGIAFGGRAAGIFPLSAASASTEGEPTPVAQAMPDDQTAPTEAVVGCDVQTWWNAQQGHVDFLVTIYDRVTAASPADSLEAVVAQIQAERDAVLLVPSGDCVSAPLDILTQAVNGTLNAVQSLVSNDRTGAAISATNATTAFSNTLVTLWDAGIATDPNTPPNLGIGRNACDMAELDAWYAPFRQQWERANPLIAQADIPNATPETVQTLVATLEDVRANLLNTSAPVCADRARQLSVIALNSYINAANATQQGNADAARESASTYARSRVALNAWLLWLGVGTV